MANKIYRGEKISIAGQLKDNDVVTTAYGLTCKVYSMRGQLLKSVPLTINQQTQSYSCSIDTDDMHGLILFRFIANTAQGEIIVNDEDIVRQIYL